MDRNRDGVVTRAEWRGSAQSFRNHDWNGDGRLSGDEIRPGAQRSGVPDEDYLLRPAGNSMTGRRRDFATSIGIGTDGWRATVWFR